jgi:DNA replication protein DnaC
MKRLSDSLQLKSMLHQLKARQASRPAEYQHDQSFLDFSSLHPCSLEREGWLIPSAAYITPREVPYCGRCQDGYLFSVDEFRRQTAHICHYCEVTRRHLKRLAKLQLPSDAYGMHWGTYEWDTLGLKGAVEEMTTWARSREGRSHVAPSILVYGPPGNGKTSLLYCLARDLVWQGQRVMFTTHSRLMDQIKRSFSGDKDPLERWLDQTDVLLFDELGGIGGGGNWTDWYQAQSIEIIGRIYERWASGQLMVAMTTNLPPAGIASLFKRNRAVMSRLQAIFVEPLEMIGKDRRAQADLTSWGL